jgi:hypothetical protein
MNNTQAFYVRSPSSLNSTYIVIQTARDECGPFILLVVASYNQPAGVLRSGP